MMKWFWGEHISMREIECVIKHMKEKKVTDESGLISVYLKTLKDGAEMN